MHVSNLYLQGVSGTAHARIATISGLDRVFFCNSGTEARDTQLAQYQRIGVGAVWFALQLLLDSQDLDNRGRNGGSRLDCA
jgi:hypothetical protein